MTQPSTIPPLAPRDLAVWRSFPIFAAADPETLAELATRATRRHFPAGQTLFRKGDPGNTLLALTDGRIKMSILSGGGRELLIRVAEPGDLVGEIACLDGGERSTDATAMTEVDALVIRREDLRDVAARHPDLHEAAIAHLAGLLRSTNDRLEAVALHPVEVRVARFLLFTLHSLHGPDPGNSATLTPNLSQTDIGLMIGATRSKVNRVLQDFRERRILEQDGPVWRCDVAALRALVEE
ncbi:Crp/Fnr family transcriptional regulator [Rhodobacter sp. SY28-1]|uniref:Crp/Fnr family transcriptional regulator n=1 Tax=Rhodobacter sp. SY28-1 TaxID=2562317 RepID=UPI0010BFCA5A|nr:Crp/Fnr family transcriptional regulator [Rhodobacter sp. SY28-1]